MVICALQTTSLRPTIQIALQLQRVSLHCTPGTYMMVNLEFGYIGPCCIDGGLGDVSGGEPMYDHTGDEQVEEDRPGEVGEDDVVATDDSVLSSEVDTVVKGELDGGDMIAGLLSATPLSRSSLSISSTLWSSSSRFITASSVSSSCCSSCWPSPRPLCLFLSLRFLLAPLPPSTPSCLDLSFSSSLPSRSTMRSMAACSMEYRSFLSVRVTSRSLSNCTRSRVRRRVSDLLCLILSFERGCLNWSAAAAAALTAAIVAVVRVVEEGPGRSEYGLIAVDGLGVSTTGIGLDIAAAVVDVACVEAVLYEVAGVAVM